MTVTPDEKVQPDFGNTDPAGALYINIPTGTFTQGAHPGIYKIIASTNLEPEITPPHRVTITKPLAIMQHPVIVNMFKDVMGYNRAYYDDPNAPPAGISANLKISKMI